MSNLRQLGLALNMYIIENENAYPVSLDELLEHTVHDEYSTYDLHCPEARKPSGR
jgi:hypothetical protein